MLICLLLEALLSKRKLLNVTRYSCFFQYCICYITKFPPFLSLIFQSSFIKKRYRIPLFVEKFPELNIYDIKQPTMFLSVLISMRRYEWASVQLSSRQKAKAKVLISFCYQKVCCLFTCSFGNNA